MRCLLSLKSNTYPEGRLVNGAGISGKVYAQYPGRPLSLSEVLPLKRFGGKRIEESAEAIVSRKQPGEGPNIALRDRNGSCI